MRLIQLTCSKCGASLNLDLDNLQAYCPYCGQKLMIDMDQMNQILTEKEKTKRQQMEYDHETQMKEMENKDRWKTLKWAGILFAFCMAILIVMAILEKLGVF
jgi:DNA-directed RNA polymerase subunit RPC12/RpoP